eukprot:PhM_4_TR10992/c0_g1_i1/m.80655/K18460/XPO7, EXP7; exportin-7
MANLQQIDEWCRVFYMNQASKNELLSIHAELTSTFNRPGQLDSLRELMTASQEDYTHFFCAQMVNTIVLDSWNVMTVQARRDLGQWLNEVVLFNRANFKKFVITSLAQAFARVTKFSWLDDEEVQGTPRRIADTLLSNASNTQTCVLGLNLLQNLVVEVNTLQAKRPIAVHRKTSHSFRDSALMNIFRVGLDAMKQCRGTEEIVTAAAGLCAACLNYDFAGLFIDELDDSGNTQIPMAWAALFSEMDVVGLLWELYGQYAMPDILRCLTLLGACRRTFFSNEADRAKWLAAFISGVVELLRTERGLDKEEVLQEVCRMHAKLKGTYQLTELVNCVFFEQWMGLIADFSFKCFERWEDTFQSQHTLMVFWSRMASSQRYATAPTMLQALLQDVLRRFVQCRVAMAGVIESNPEQYTDDPLREPDSVLDSISGLPPLVRLNYAENVAFLCEMADGELTALSNCDPKSKERQVRYARVAWIVYIISNTVRMTSSAPGDMQETGWCDGDLSAIVFRLIQMFNPQVAPLRSPALASLELAILHYLSSFRMVHIGDTNTPVTKVYERIAALLGPQFGDVTMTLDFIAQKVIYNLRFWWEDRMIMDDSLQIFVDLSNGYSSGKQLLQLNTVRQLCESHCNNTTGFDFLTNYQCSKHRTKYFRALTVLFFMDSCSEAMFAGFMQPVQFALDVMREDVGRCRDSNSMLNPQTCRIGVILGALRDLRGVCLACTVKRSYMMFFSWVFHNHIDTLLGLAGVCYSQPEIATSLCKFFADFVFNRHQRVCFDNNSPDGIYLFKRTSAFLQIMSQQFCRKRAQANPATDPDTVHMLNKHLTAMLDVLSHLLSGGYCNFGVFKVYNDPTLVDAVEATLAMLDIGVSTDLFEHNKLSVAYFSVINELCTQQADYMCAQTTQRFMGMLHAIEAALQTRSRFVTPHAANAIQSLATHIHKLIARKAPELEAISGHMAADPTVLARIMENLFSTILYDDTANLWSMSRPLLPLIYICRDAFGEMRDRVIQSALPDKRALVAEAFEKLMSPTDDTLDNTVRDRFTQHLTTFKHTIKGLI